MLHKIMRPQHVAWCVLCPWTERVSSYTAYSKNPDREWETHYNFFHNPEAATGHKPNGHTHYTMHGYVEDCVCGSSFNGEGVCLNAHRFGYTEKKTETK